MNKPGGKLKNDGRGVSPVVATIMLFSVAIIAAATVGVVAFGFQDGLREPQDPRAFSDVETTLGSEHRSWGGWDDRESGNAPRGDIDVVRLTYQSGPVFKGDDIGAVVVRWRGASGGGQVRFLNPARFGKDTAQIDHPDESIGEFCTGDLRAGETLTIRMVHNRYQLGGDTDQEGDEPYRYVGSGQNDIAKNGDSDEPFFRVNNRYPVRSSGDRPIEPGDTVEVLFFGPEDEQPISRVQTTARVFTGDPAERDKGSC